MTCNQIKLNGMGKFFNKLKLNSSIWENTRASNQRDFEKRCFWAWIQKLYAHAV